MPHCVSVPISSSYGRSMAWRMELDCAYLCDVDVGRSKKKVMPPATLQQWNDFKRGSFSGRDPPLFVEGVPKQLAQQIMMRSKTAIH